MLCHISQNFPDFVEPSGSNKSVVNGIIKEAAHSRGTEPVEEATSDKPALFFDYDGQERIEKASEETVNCSDPYEDTLEPIAIVGIAFRGPQDATSPSALWELLEQRRSAMTAVPASRFNVAAFSDVDNGKAGLKSVGGGHFLKEDLAAFDAPFFAMSATEASGMDPQQRWLLETTYEALENAGIPLQTTAGTKTSVHIGNFTQEYTVLLNRDLQMKTPYKAIGTGPTMLANRLSWFYDWSGPSIAIDTACSSSLTAIHLACQALRTGDSDMGVAGGCNVIINPDFMFALTDMGFLSPDNVCKSFDTNANGYSRGEGFGLVILKRLKDAIRDDDVVRAVIRATGVNQDAKTPSITQPSSKWQEVLIRETYEAGGLSMEATRFFEAHGTGTSVGDPIEAAAIRAAFKEQLADHPLYIGSVKSNLGHLGGASGVAGLIKAVLALERGTIPPNLWPNDLNPKISTDWNLQFPRSRLPWPCSGLRRASVNSFGYGGSNAHCVVDDAYHYFESRGLRGNHNTRHSTPLSRTGLPIRENNDMYQNAGTVLLVWSAPDEKAVKRLTTLHTEYLASTTQGEIYDCHRLAYTLSERRTKFPWKSFSICSRQNSSNESLTMDRASPVIRSLKDPSICFVFSGQGAQSARMGIELKSYPVFARALDYADEFYRPLGACWSVVDELEKDKESSTIDSPELSQPLCTALQLALVHLLNAWNVRPRVVVGHSSGEIAAAFAAGAISQDAALKIAYFRGIVAASTQQTAQCSQGMMSVNLSRRAAEDCVNRVNTSGHYLTVACSNTSNNVTISGDASGLNYLQTTLSQDGIFCRKLKVNVAYHSRYMNSVANLYGLLMGRIECGSPSDGMVTMISTVTAKPVSKSDLCQSSYWIRNLTSMVNFDEAIGMLAASQSITSRKLLSRKLELQVDHFLEIGPHPVLKTAIRESYTRGSVKTIPNCSTMLDRRSSALMCTLQAAGELYSIGAPINILDVNNIEQTEHMNFFVDLPSYPFDRSKLYWQESRISHEFRFRKHKHHGLLGNQVMEWNPLEPNWRNIFHISDNPWVTDHSIQGSTVLPATCTIALVVEAARQYFESEKASTGYQIKNMVTSKAIVISAEPGNVEWQTHLRPHPSSSSASESWADFHLYVYENASWIQACTGMVGVHFDDLFDELMPSQGGSANGGVGILSKDSKCKFTPEQFYDSVRPLGYDYGPSFQGVKELTVNATNHEAYGVASLNHWKLDSTKEVDSAYIIHPAAFDAVLQFSLAASLLGRPDSAPQILPSQFDEIWISSKLKDRSALPEAHVHASLDSEGFRAAQFSLNVRDESGNSPLIYASFQATFTQARETLAQSVVVSDAMKTCYHVDWQPDVDFLSEEAFGEIFEVKQANQELLARDADNECLVSLICERLKERELSSKLLSAHPHLKSYLDWMRNAPGRHMGAPIQHVCHEEIESLLNRVEKASIVGQLTAKVAKALPRVLDGDLDPLELLFEDELLDAYYADAHGSADVFANIARYVSLLGHKNPSLRVLEIGAGTGGCTTSVLKALSEDKDAGQYVARFSEYSFTDISPSFFERAREKFSQNAQRMQFKTFNVENDLESQGIKPFSYDLVVASNVIHATACIQKTLTNTRRLLKPGGSFILYEGIKPDALTPGLTFGLLSGWWLATEQYRKHGPLLTEEKWDEELQAAGFTSPYIKLRDDQDPQVHGFTAMISKAAPQSDECRQPNSRVAILIQDTDVSREIAEAIRSKLDWNPDTACETPHAD